MVRTKELSLEKGKLTCAMHSVCYLCIVTQVTWMFCIHGRYLMHILVVKKPILNICLFFDAV